MWSKSNLPAAAKKLKGHSADIFVAAANAALDQYNGNEGHAIATGLSAVKKHKDSLKTKSVSKSSLDGLVEGFKALLEQAFGSRDDIEPTVEVTKSVDIEQRRAMFVVLEPDVVDLHGDTYSAEEVEKACTNFNTHCMKANLFHRVMTDDAKVEQSFITPASFTTDDGREIKKGTWLTWMNFPETPNGELIWKMVKEGDITGVSIGGTAKVEEIESDES